jgi:hypothetical protein
VLYWHRGEQVGNVKDVVFELQNNKTLFCDAPSDYRHGIGLLLYTTVATLCCWGINVKRWSVHPPGFTLQNNIDCFIACGAPAKGVFMDDGELMLQKSYGKLETSATGDLMKDGDPRLQEVLRKIETSTTGDLMKDGDLKLQ